MFCPIKCGSTDQFVYPNLQNQLNHIRTGPVCLQWQALSIMHGYIYIVSLLLPLLLIIVILLLLYTCTIYVYIYIL